MFISINLTGFVAWITTFIQGSGMYLLIGIVLAIIVLIKSGVFGEIHPLDFFHRRPSWRRQELYKIHGEDDLHTEKWYK
jgi:hypothetical protein